MKIVPTATSHLLQLLFPHVLQLAVEHSQAAEQVGSLAVKEIESETVMLAGGGGSIARVDSGGALVVGPQSAGADPGPACFPWKLT